MGEDVFLADEQPHHGMDRRAAERWRSAVEVSFFGESPCLGAVSANVSRGGLFVPTDELRAVGTRVLVTLSLPKGEVRTVGVVRWVRQVTDGGPPGLGIAFEGLPDTKRNVIDAFCRRGPS